MTSCRPFVRVGSLIGLAIFLFSFHALSASSSKLEFFRYKIESESTNDWKVHAAIDRAGTSEILALYTLKKDDNVKLMAYRRSNEGSKICSREKSAMNIARVPYETIKAPKGWECVFAEKDKSRVTAVKTFSIKGKSRSTPFALVVVSESLPRDRFMKVLSSLKDLK